LATEGLIRNQWIDGRTNAFYVTPSGFAEYSVIMRRRGQPIDRVERVVRSYVEAATFQKRYPAAYGKWSQAEVLLWGDDASSILTTIGHLVREAMQEFATALVNVHRPIGVEPDASKTVARIKAVLRASRLGSTEREFLDALIAYWGTVCDLSQRQEHGGQREGSPLVWRDARRLVFRAATVMFEIDEALSSAAPS
jgi:hypothetical protein